MMSYGSQLNLRCGRFVLRITLSFVGVACGTPAKSAAFETNASSKRVPNTLVVLTALYGGHWAIAVCYSNAPALRLARFAAACSAHMHGKTF